jgi:hypothetical protein
MWQPDAPEGMQNGQSFSMHRPALRGSSGPMQQSPEVPLLLHAVKAAGPACAPHQGGLQQRMPAFPSAGSAADWQPSMQSSMPKVLRDDQAQSAPATMALHCSISSENPLLAAPRPRTHAAPVGAEMMSCMANTPTLVSASSGKDSTALDPNDTPHAAGAALPTVAVRDPHAAAPVLETSSSVDAELAGSTSQSPLGPEPTAGSAHDGEEAAAVQHVAAGKRVSVRAQRRASQRQGAWGRWWPRRSCSAASLEARAKQQRRWSMLLQVCSMLEPGHMRALSSGPDNTAF